MGEDLMNKNVNVWGREISLKIIFDVYNGENILDSQKEALDSFLKAADGVLASCEELKKYCLKRDGEHIGNSIENIFKYVIPESLYVRRIRQERDIVLLCRYQFDEEHGIAMFFENEALKHIGSQDEI
jgi:hypothetical protein